MRHFSDMDGKQRQLLIAQIASTARKLEKEYGACSRCTLFPFQEHLALGGEEAYLASVPFSGGVAGNGEVCGALIGALMAIGLAYGNGEVVWGSEEDRATFADVRVHSNRVCDRFRERFGSLKCTRVQTCIHGRSWDLRDPESAAEFSKKEIHDKCGDVVYFAAELAAKEIILETEAK